MLITRVLPNLNIYRETRDKLEGLEKQRLERMKNVGDKDKETSADALLSRKVCNLFINIVEAFINCKQSDFNKFKLYFLSPFRARQRLRR